MSIKQSHRRLCVKLTVIVCSFQIRDVYVCYRAKVSLLSPVLRQANLNCVNGGLANGCL